MNPEGHSAVNSKGNLAEGRRCVIRRGRYLPALRPLLPAQQLRQLGDVRGDAPGLVADNSAARIGAARTQ
jgi:hypothetical protein